MPKYNFIDIQVFLIHGDYSKKKEKKNLAFM